MTRLLTKYEKSHDNVGPTVFVGLRYPPIFFLKLFFLALVNKYYLHPLSGAEAEELAHNLSRWQIVRLLREKQRGRKPVG